MYFTKRILALVLAVLLVIPSVLVFSASADEVLVSYGKSYTVSGTGVGKAQYTANLTDGVVQDKLSYDDKWFALYYQTGDNVQGINAPDGIGTITIDLGEEVGGLSTYKAHIVTNYASGIGTPEYIRVSVSGDNETFVDVGDLSTPTAEATVPEWVTLTTEAGISARYVRFTVKLGSGVFAFLDELEVYSGYPAPDPEPDPDPDPEPSLPLGASAACEGYTLGTFNDLPACVNADGDLHLCENNFPDEGFRAGLRGEHHFWFPEGDVCLSVTSDNCLYKRTAKTVTSMYNDGNWGGVKSVKGIEFFENLNYLDFSGLKSLDISHNKKLVRLSCINAEFASLDVSNNPELKYLYCSDSRFTSLDLSHNPKLEELSCSGNKLTQLDLSHNPKLEVLHCYNNDLTQLDLTHNPELAYLSCSNNALKQLDLPNGSKLTSLGCANNQLVELDVSGSPVLKYLNCNDNQLTSLDVRKNLKLTSLECLRNRLTALDLSRNASLTYLDCYDNMIVRLEMGDVENARYNPQYKYLALTPGETSFDMRRLVADGNLGRITEVLGLYVDPGFLDPMESVENLCEYHPETGIVTLEKEYEYYDPVQFLNMSIKLFVGEDHEDLNLIVMFSDDPDKEIPDVEPEPDAPLTDEEYIADIIAKTGDATENSSFDLVIEAPAEYRAGSEFDVTVRIANITDEEGLVSLLADLYYDAEKLLLLNAVDEEGIIDCILLPDTWECLVKYDRDEDHNIIYNGHITLAVLTGRNKPVTADGALTFKLRFAVKEGAENAAGIYIPNESISAKRFDLKDLYGNGGYAIIKEHIGGGADGACDGHEYEKFNSAYACVNSDGELHICDKNFPDEAFRNYLAAEFDKDNNGYFSVAEAEGVISIECPGMEIASVKGIAYFAYLSWLNCRGNSLTELDVSDCPNLVYLNCSDNLLAELDVSNNPNLIHLYCSDNRLTALDVSANTELEDLDCSSRTFYYIYALSDDNETAGNKITSLDVSKNTKLASLYCENNALTSLDVSKNLQLVNLNCEGNSLTSLDVSKNTQLAYLSCGNNALTALDVSKNTKLCNLSCYYNRITSLDVSKNTKLEWLDCDGNALTALNVSKNTELIYLACSENSISALDVSKNTKLVDLYCGSNALKSLDVSKNTKLEYLGCWSNEIKSLNISKNTELVNLYCGDNQLTSLDVSKNTKLVDLMCYDNKLKSLDISKNTELARLNCSDNAIKSLDISKNTKLEYVGCEGNRITELVLGNVEPENLYAGYQDTESVIKPDAKSFDMRALVSEENLGNVSVDASIGTYDPATGILTFAPDYDLVENGGFSYTYSPGSDSDMYVFVELKEKLRLPGDVDDDGKITMVDCLYLKRYILGTFNGTINLENADVDGNGKIDAMDYLYLKRGYLGTFDLSKFA